MSKPKKIKYRLIDCAEPTACDICNLLDEVRERYRPDLQEAKIALAWIDDVKPDVDDHVMLGRAKKASDLDRELHEWDFVILINADAWGEFSAKQRKALLLHELTHCDIAMDKQTGKPRRDIKDRLVFRVRKHDIEEFECVVKEFGCYKKDLERFADALAAKKRAKKETPLLSVVDGDEAEAV